MSVVNLASFPYSTLFEASGFFETALGDGEGTGNEQALKLKMDSYAWEWPAFAEVLKECLRQ